MRLGPLAAMIGVILVVVIIGLPGPALTADDALAEAAALQQKAAALYQQGSYAEIEPVLKRAIEILEARLGPDDPKLADSLGYLADLYATQGRYRDAEPLYRRVLAIRENSPGPDRLDLGASLNGLAGLYKLAGRYAESEELFRRALEIVENAPHPPDGTIATILNNIALIYQNQGRYDEAEPLYWRAIEVAGKTPEADRLLGPIILNNLAGLYKEQRRYDEAEPLYSRVLQLREQAATPLDLTASLNNLASVYDAEKRYREAEPLFRRALEIREKALGPEHPDVAQSLNNLAGVYWNDGRYDEAEPLLRRALKIRENTLAPDHPDIATALNNLAALYWNEGRLDDALAASERGITVIEGHLAANAGQRSDAASAEYRKSRVYFANYVGIGFGVAARQPKRQAAIAADTLRVAQLAEASNAAQAVASMTARFGTADDALALAIRDRQDLAARRQRLDAEIVTMASHPEAERNRAEQAALRTALAETSQAVDALDRKIGAQFPEYAELASPKPVPTGIVQSLLAPDEALLVYFTTAKETWFWVVRPNSVALFRADLEVRAATAEVEALRSVLTLDLGPYRARQAFALYDKILAPALPQLADAHHLIIVPDGALQSLPFGILVTKQPEHDPESLSDHRGVAWLARDYAISVLPAVSALRALRQTRPARVASAPFLGVGDPVLVGDPNAVRGVALAKLFRGAGADIRQLPALPETADELRAIAKTLGASDSDLLLGERASEPILRQMPLDRYRVIEFATHGLLSGELGGLSEAALVLTPPREATPGNDGLLTASKIATLKLDADWLVLSACNTAAGDGTPDAGGWSGLAKAFFYAGARSVLVSHWPVWSKSTIALTTGAFAELAKDPAIGRAEALRRAEMAMLDPDKPPEFAHPLAWAPFVLAGEGGAGR